MGIPAPTLQYLASGGSDLWERLRGRLERNGLSPHGYLAMDLSPSAADVLSGVFGRPVPPGRTRLRLDELDAALRRSAAGAGVVDVTAAVTGSPLADRKQVNTDRAAASADLTAALDAAVNGVGFAAAHTQVFLAGVRTSGILAKAGTDASLQAIAWFKAGWAELVRDQVFDDPDIGSAPVWGRGELASKATASAHGFDDGKLAANLILRAVAVACDLPAPKTVAERHSLWERAGVAADDVSGTALTWGFQPPGDDRWSAMIRERTSLGVVTHLTPQELRVAGNVPLAWSGVTVFACETPQILCAAESPHPYCVCPGRDRRRRGRCCGN